MNTHARDAGEHDGTVIRLNVPYSSQLDEKTYTSHADGGLASLAMILNANKPAAEQVTVAALEGRHLRRRRVRHFTTISELLSVGRSEGLAMSCQVFADANQALTELHNLLQAGRPFITLVNYSRWHAIARKSPIRGYLVVVTGYDEEHVYVHDPLFRSGRPNPGEFFMWGNQQFLDGWGSTDQLGQEKFVAVVPDKRVAHVEEGERQARTSYRDAFCQPEFDALVLQLWATAGGDLWHQAANMLQRAVMQVLGTSSHRWQIIPVAGMPTYFDLVPPPEQHISVKQAFDLKNALKREESVAYVESVFEANLDNLPEESMTDEELRSAADIDNFPKESLATENLRSATDLATPWEKLTAIERNPLWNHELIRTEAAWQHSRGRGILIAHPDTGYIPHFELDGDRIRRDLEGNFYDSAPGANNSHERGGNHGLGTATVLMSGMAQQSETHFVTGVAPEAMLAPMRITKKGAPIFFSRSGPRRVRNAIRHAIDSDCHIISMSLGGPFEKSLHEAIQEAVQRNIIVCAAAGNVVGFVVWPARYEEVIAVAACTADRKKWIHSSRGPTVDVTAPGHNVWRAYIDEFGRQKSRPGSGTSYATPHVAGIAALWLAKHGRDRLLEKYRRVPLCLVFREVLKAACDPPPEDHQGQFGAGIVNAARTLTAELPDEDELAARFLEPTFTRGLLEAEPPKSDYFSSIFDTQPPAEVRQRLAALLDIPESDLEARLQVLNREELAFYLITDPDLREFVTGWQVAEAELSSTVLSSTTAMEHVFIVPDAQTSGQGLREKLLNAPLSDELRAQLTVAPEQMIPNRRQAQGRER
jgi:hypothetical protein